MFNSHEIKGALAPVQDYLVLRPILEDEKVGGLFRPDNARAYGRCPVVAAGPKCELKKGDVVYIQRFVEGELKFTLNGETVYAIRERHVNVAINEKGPLKLRAVGNRILVRRLADQKGLEKRGRIWIPEKASEKTQRCEVLSVGGGMDKGEIKPFEVKVGTVVLIARYAGTEVRYGDEEYTIINENDVVGTLVVDMPKVKRKAAA